jgi:hypothetical protein
LPRLFLNENELAERRSPAGTGELIGFEDPEENNRWKMPVGAGGQNDRRPNRQAERRQLGCVAKVAPSTRCAVVGVCRACAANNEEN